MPYLFTILVLKFEIFHSTTLFAVHTAILQTHTEVTSKCVYNIAVCMANSVDLDQMPCTVGSDLGLHYLQRPICPWM